MPKSFLSLDDVLAAECRLAGALRHTPTRHAANLSAEAGCDVWLKHEYLQETGAFKERGARNALAKLTLSQRQRGVIAASAGNHALGLALHGRKLGVQVTVVVPRSAPQVKVERCRALGARVVLVDGGFEAAAAHALTLSLQKGLRLVHPFDDADVAAGQGTLALELLADAGSVDAVVLPVGGGGLLAGAATAIKALRPQVKVVAVEPIHAPSLTTALAVGRPAPSPVHPSLADGLSVSTVSQRAVDVAHSHVDHVLTVSEEEIQDALWALHRYEGVLVEGAAAAGVAAVVSGRVSALGYARVACPLTGANIQPEVHAQALRAVEFRRQRAA